MKLNEVRPDVTGPEIGVIDREREDLKPKQPPMYHVFLNNDDYVEGGAVVGALVEAFGVGQQTALQIMIAAHREGKALVGTFSRDVAETKAAKASDWVTKFHADKGIEGGVSSYLFTVEPAE